MTETTTRAALIAEAAEYPTDSAWCGNLIQDLAAALADAERELELQAETVTTLRMFCAALRCVGHKGSGGVTAGGIADLITEILARRA